MISLLIALLMPDRLHTVDSRNVLAAQFLVGKSGKSGSVMAVVELHVPAERKCVVGAPQTIY